MKLTRLTKLTFGALVMTSVVACDQLPAGGPGTEDGSSDSATLSGGQGFSGGVAQKAPGVPQQAMTSLLGLWRGECEDDMSRDQGGDYGQHDPNGGPGPKDDGLTTTQQQPGALPLFLTGQSQGERPDRYRMEEMRFTREGAVHKDLMFKADGCGAGEQSLEFIMHLNYRVGGEVATAPGARELDLKMMGGEISVLDADIIAMFNEYGMCGKSDWVAGEPVDLKDVELALCGDGGKDSEGSDEAPAGGDTTATDTSAADQTVPTTDQTVVLPLQDASSQPVAQQPMSTDSKDQGGEKGKPEEIGDEIFEIYKIEGSTLYFGGSDGSGDRPTEIDSERAYEKVIE